MTPAQSDDVDTMSDGEARAEVRRLRRVVTKLVEPTFGAFREDGDGVALGIRSPTGPLVIGALVEMLGTAKNYVALTGWHPVAGHIEAIVQRVGRLSPHEARVEAEQHLARAVALLGEHGIPWDGPTTFLPEMPPRDTAVELDQTGERPWMRLDITTEPNTLVCQRCGTRQEMPRRGTTQVLTAVITAFRDQHADCQEGDTP